MNSRRLPKPKPAKAALKPVRGPVLDLLHLPVICRIADVAAVYRISAATIRRGVQNNEFRPIPFEKYPYRWLREDIIRDLQTRHPKLKTRRHGFAAAKAKRQALEDKTATK